MNRLLLSALKFFLLVLAIGAVALGAILLVQYLHWPQWAAAALMAAVFALVFFGFFLRRLYYRRREAEFVRRVVDQDRQSIEAAPIHERHNLLELQERWNTAIATLRASKLKDRGNPLYRLPWFMVFGETGSGKSTAISHARLSAVLTDAGPVPGIGGTRNCDWWFFEEAIILDTAGRYAVPLNEAADREEWERFLALLARYRRREPLSGLIVTLPTDRLLAGTEDDLAAYGSAIRRRLDELMRILGAKFPVYVLITKLDLILGMTAVCELLPEEQRNQALGLLNPDAQRDAEEFLEEALEHIVRRLKDLRLALGVRTGQTDGKAALFPDELAHLAPRIRTFIAHAFSENPYQETPFLRGIFVSSGRQSGMTRSGVLGALESLQGKQWRLPDANHGLFLRDFFAAILPKERGLFTYLEEYLSWQKSLHTFGLAAWLLVLLAGIGLSSLAYVQVRGAMAPIQHAFPHPPQWGHNLTQDILQAGRLRDRIAAMDAALSSGLWPNMGFQQGRELLNLLKPQYATWFREHVLFALDKAMNEYLASQDRQGRKELLAQVLHYLTWRVNILRTRTTQASLAQDAAPIEALGLAFGGQLPEVASFFPDMYRDYVAWERDPGILRREAQELQVWAGRLVEVAGEDLHWLVDWAHGRPDLIDVTVDDFWPGLGQARHAVSVNAAFTARGKAAIETLLAQLSTTVADPEAFAARTKAFWRWYHHRFYEEWKAFAEHFDAGAEKLLTREDWLSTAAAMTSLENPYFKLLERMKLEFDAAEKLAPPPAWALMPERFAAVLTAYRAQHKQVTVEKQAAEAATKHITAVLAKFDQDVLDHLEQMLQATEALHDYLQQMAAILPATASADAAFRFTTQHFGGAALPAQGGAPAQAPSVQPSTVDQAVAALRRMQPLLGDPQAESPLWRLMDGPLVFLATLATYESACALDELWQSQVRAKVQHVPQDQLWEALFGDKGVALSFVQGPAQPFLRHTPQGWAAKEWLGVPFPFEPALLNLLDQGSVRRQQLQPKYTVSIAALPTNVNRDAKSEPYAVRLFMQCAEKKQQLENFNYPSTQDFVWEPATCGAVTLEIVFREATVTQTWSGPWGFRDFLRDFRNGSHVYEPKDFPQEQGVLEGLGVRRIQVNYRITGAQPILALDNYPALRVPENAAFCWAGLGAAGVLPSSPSSNASAATRPGDMP